MAGSRARACVCCVYVMCVVYSYFSIDHANRLINENTSAVASRKKRSTLSGRDYLALPCLALPYLVLSRLVLSYLVLSRLVLPCLATAFIGSFEKVVWKLEDPAVLARERQQREQEKVTFVFLPSCSFDAPIRVLFLFSTKSFFSPHCVCVFFFRWSECQSFF